MAFSKARRLSDLVSSAGEVSSFVDASVTHADLHTSMDLTGKTVTVANASTGDSDTTAANTAFVQQEIAALVDSAPGTLNTLNELAAALGDDASFSTTVTNSIATKLPLAGGTLTGNLTGKAITLAPDTAGKLTIRLTTNAANDGRIVIRSDTTDKVDIQANGISYFNGGHLLVAKTASDGTTIGAELRSTGVITSTVNANVCGNFNRKTSDGTILNFQKDNTTVGSIGTEATDIYIGTTDTGIRFNDAVNGVLPYNTSSGQTDNTVDLGFSSVRWRDLHLAGIASIGNLKIGTDQGTDGQLLTSTGSGIAWEDAPASGPSKGLALAFSLIF